MHWATFPPTSPPPPLTPLSPLPTQSSPLLPSSQLLIQPPLVTPRAPSFNQLLSQCNNLLPNLSLPPLPLLLSILLYPLSTLLLASPLRRHNHLISLTSLQLLRLFTTLPEVPTLVLLLYPLNPLPLRTYLSLQQVIIYPTTPPIPLPLPTYLPQA